MARAQLERLLQAWCGPAWASQRIPPALAPSSWAVRTPSGCRPAGAPAHSPVGEGIACALGVRRASQAALALEGVRETAAKRTGRSAAATAATTTICYWPKPFPWGGARARARPFPYSTVLYRDSTAILFADGSRFGNSDFVTVQDGMYVNRPLKGKRLAQSQPG